MADRDTLAEEPVHTQEPAQAEVAGGAGPAVSMPSMLSNVPVSAMRRRIARRIARRAEGVGGFGEHAGSLVEQASAGSGHSVDAGVRSQVERVTGADLSGVRVHTDAASQQAAQSIQAQAYTVGQDIHFGAGRYQPGTAEGNHLIAHELAHTIQQSGASAGSGPQTKLEVSEPGDSSEHEADRVADAAMSAQPGVTQAVTPVSAGVSRKMIQRNPDGAQAHAPQQGQQPAQAQPAQAGGGYSAQSLQQAVVNHQCPEAVRIAALNPSQAMTDLNHNAASAEWGAGHYFAAIGSAIAGVFGGGSLKSAFFSVVKNGKPYAAATRARLGTIYHGVTLADKKHLFEAQFSVSISGQAVTGGGQAEFSQAELDGLYDQAALLPPAHVEGNPNFVRLYRTQGALAEGSYGSPQINMDALKGNTAQDLARYTQVMRHEVGHAVDDRIGAPVVDLRLNQAGWHKYASAEEWITAMGGLGTIPANLHATVRQAVQAYLGRGSAWGGPTQTFEATLQAKVMAAHPEVTACAADGSDAVSRDMTALRALYGSSMVLKACIGSEGQTSHWNYTHRPIASGKAFFINHYYPGYYSVAESTHNNLVQWGNSAAAFSDKEWFAEVYAEWYGPTASRNFPGYVVSFFNNTVERVGQPAQPQPAQPAAQGGAQGGAQAGNGAAAPPQGASGYPKVPRSG